MGHYGLYLSPTFSNAGLNRLLSSVSGAGRSASTAHFNVGDIFESTAADLWPWDRLAELTPKPLD